ncbi:MAG: MASE1 domain-containing protein [Actinomycetia bacterium]|nr:MASE1 domain-containing protein [Actinomycetes bacterium]
MLDEREHYWRDAPLWLKAVAAAVLYFVAAQLGNSLSVQHEFSTFWPPAGILLVLLVMTEPRQWIALIAAAAVANVSSDLLHDRALAVGLGFAFANCAEASLGAALVRRFVGTSAIVSSRPKVFGFAALAAVVAPAAGATIGAAVLSLAYGTSSLAATWATWWSGDALGVLTVGSFGLAAADLASRLRRGARVTVTPTRSARFLALLAVASAAGWWLVARFGPLTGWKSVIFLPVLLATASFGPFGAASMGIVLTVSMTAGLVSRWGEVNVASGQIGLEVFGLQAFLAVVVFAALYIAASLEEARAAEAASHTAAEKYRVLLETLPIGVTISDESGAIIETSESAADILGITTDEHRRRDIAGAEWAIVGPDGLEKPPEEWTSVKALSDRSRERSQEGVRRPDGSVVWLDVSAAPIPLPGYGVAITFQDVTEQVSTRDRLRQSEMELKKAADHLEAQVAERTAEIQAANEELVEASQAKSRFLANMSHELRTPLNSIIGFSDVMWKEMAGPVTDEQRKQLAMINSSGKHLLGLVNDVLDLERIETGHEVVVPERFDLGALVRDVRDALEPQSTAKGIELRLDLPDEPLKLTSDRAKVKQVLLNLTDNAVKFTDTGMVSITCAVHGSGVVVSVEDTGIGIRREDLPLIMDDFHQVDRSDGIKPSGTGLGLSISKRLVEMLRGRIEAESELGHGSTFRVTLPNLDRAPTG